MTRTTKRALKLAPLMVLLLAACGGDNSEDTTADTNAPTDETSAASGDTADEEPEVTSLTIGMGAMALPQVATVVGVEKGFFEAEGVEAEYSPFQGGPAAIQALLSGDADIAEADFPPLLNTYGGPDDLVAILEDNAFTNYAYYGAEGIESFQDLVDQDGVVGVSAIGGVDHILLRRAFEEEGIDAGSVNFRAAGGSAERARAALAGQIQLVAATPPGKYELQEAGLTEIGALSDFLDTFPTNTYIVPREFYEANPNTIAAVRRGFNNTAEWMRDNADESVDIFMEAISAPPDRRADYERALQEYLPFYAPDEPSTDGYRLFIEYFMESGELEAESVDQVLNDLLQFD